MALAIQEEKVNQQNCETKSLLLTEYQKAMEAYSKAVAELARNIGIIPPIENDKLNLSAERARILSAAARDKLDAHMNEHGC